LLILAASERLIVTECLIIGLLPRSVIEEQLEELVRSKKLTSYSDLLPNLKATVFGGAMLESRELAQFMRFLQDDLAISDVNLQLALRHPEQTPSLLPMILWQYGLVTVTQLNQIFDWLES